jgi:formylglycine-generating enzyme required for sulfatase activity
MHGKVWQWCNDWHDNFPGGAEHDPSGPSSGSLVVTRGGSWSMEAWFCRSAYRTGGKPEYRGADLGFRIAAQATPTSSHVQPGTSF